MKFKIKLERTNINLIDASHFPWGLACINVPMYWPQHVFKIDYVSSLCPGALDGSFAIFHVCNVSIVIFEKSSSAISSFQLPFLVQRHGQTNILSLGSKDKPNFFNQNDEYTNI